MVGPVLQSIVPYRLRGMGVGARRDLHLLHRRDRRRAALRRCSPTSSGLAPRCSRSSIPSTIIGGFLIIRSARVHPQRPLARRRRAPGGDGGAHGASWRRPTTVPALQVVDIDFSYGPVQVLFDVGFEVQSRRGARAARHQRRGQVDDPARHRRPRHAGARRRAPQRPQHHLHHARAAGEARDPHPARRQGRVPRDDGAREPRDGGVRVPRRRRRLPVVGSTAPTTCSRRSPNERRDRRVDAVGWPAADARAGDGAAPRSRGARHRRALARPRAARRPGAARRRSSGSRPKG